MKRIKTLFKPQLKLSVFNMYIKILKGDIKKNFKSYFLSVLWVEIELRSFLVSFTRLDTKGKGKKVEKKEKFFVTNCH